MELETVRALINYTLLLLWLNKLDFKSNHNFLINHKKMKGKEENNSL